MAEAPDVDVILHIPCPACGGDLQLSSVSPTLEGVDEMRYRCACGFKYRRSPAVAVERGFRPPGARGWPCYLRRKMTTQRPIDRVNNPWSVQRRQ